MTKGQATAAVVLHAVYLLTVYILQSLVLPHFRVINSVPLLLPLAAVGIALFEGGTKGGVFALFAGILCDLSFNQPTIMFTVILTVIGILVGFLAETVVARGFPAYVALCAAALIIVTFVQMASLLFFAGAAQTVLLKTAAIQIVYSLVFTLPLYFISRALGKSAQA